VNQADQFAEWNKLCEEHEAARDAYFHAFANVNKKFAAIGQGTSAINPTGGELSEFERTWRAWDEVQRRMDAFVRQHA